MNTRKGNVWVWVGVAILVVVIVIFFIWKPAPTSMPGGPSATSTSTGNEATSTVPAHAPSGQIVPQFPKELILDTAAKVADSYAINYSATTKQYTVAWNSASSMTTLYNQYLTYLPKNGWTITSRTAGTAPVRGIYATSAKADLNLLIMPSSKGSQVTISYIAK